MHTITGTTFSPLIPETYNLLIIRHPYKEEITTTIIENIARITDTLNVRRVQYEIPTGGSVTITTDYIKKFCYIEIRTPTGRRKRYDKVLRYHVNSSLIK